VLVPTGAARPALAHVGPGGGEEEAFDVVGPAERAREVRRGCRVRLAGGPARLGATSSLHAHLEVFGREGDALKCRTSHNAIPVACPAMVEYETKGRVAILTIRRPEARNAVNGEVARAMEAALDQLEDDTDVWVGIVAGEGPVFSAGADLKAISAGQAADLQTERGGFGGIAHRQRTTPLIAAVDGPALAGGFEIVLACDMVVASTQARFGIPEVKRSLVAAAGGLFRLPRALPRNLALELAITGDPIDAERAYALGLVNVLVEPGQALEGALALAERVIANAPLAVQASRRVMLGTLTADEAQAWRITGEEFSALFRTEDFLEGPRAFIEKRPPAW